MSIRDYLDRDLAGKEKMQIVRSFGHLMPKSEVRYQGTILCAQGSYDDQIIIEAKFEGLQPSPWLHMDLSQFFPTILQGVGIYRWNGYYVKHSDYSAEFVGETKEILF